MKSIVVGGGLLSLAVSCTLLRQGHDATLLNPKTKEEETLSRAKVVPPMDSECSYSSVVGATWLRSFSRARGISVDEGVDSPIHWQKDLLVLDTYGLEYEHRSGGGVPHVKGSYKVDMGVVYEELSSSFEEAGGVIIYGVEVDSSPGSHLVDVASSEGRRVMSYDNLLMNSNPSCLSLENNVDARVTECTEDKVVIRTNGRGTSWFFDPSEPLREVSFMPVAELIVSKALGSQERIAK